MSDPLNKYDLTIGLEVHVQLNTSSKAFCSDRNAFGAIPNTQISPLSLGYPGTLPMLNEKEVEAALKLGLAFGSKINHVSLFDRKSYFYADMPKGYQITQERLPICQGGSLPVWMKDGSRKQIGITKLHMEEDAGKSLHDLDDTSSLIDLNRAGTPLLEIVTEPELQSPEEVEAFMRRMRQLVRYLGISDGNMQEGSLRCDCNISLRPKGSKTLGTRCEVKNLNSMKFARKAILYEVDRQARLIDRGEQVIRQTLQFHPDSGTTSSLRDKEEVHDYRYFPDPDLPPLRINQEQIEEARINMPVMPWDAEMKLIQEYGLRQDLTRKLTAALSSFQYFNEISQQVEDPTLAANFIVQKLLPLTVGKKTALSPESIPPLMVSKFLNLISSGKISTSLAFERLLPAWWEDRQVDPVSVAEGLDLFISSDTDSLQEIVREIVRSNPDKVRAYRSGKKGLIGYFMGELMKKTGGKAQPGLGRDLFIKELKDEDQ